LIPVALELLPPPGGFRHEAPSASPCPVSWDGRGARPRTPVPRNPPQHRPSPTGLAAGPRRVVWGAEVRAGDAPSPPPHPSPRGPIPAPSLADLAPSPTGAVPCAGAAAGSIWITGTPVVPVLGVLVTGTPVVPILGVYVTGTPVVPILGVLGEEKPRPGSCRCVCGSAGLSCPLLRCFCPWSCEPACAWPCPERSFYRRTDPTASFFAHNKF